MVEQFNLRTNKHVPESPLSSTNVTISGPIIEDEEIPLNGHVVITTDKTCEGQSDISSPPPPSDSWKTSPLYTDSTDEEEEVEDVFKSLSFGGLRNSDTMSSDMIVNSITNGELDLHTIE